MLFGIHRPLFLCEQRATLDASFHPCEISFILPPGLHYSNVITSRIECDRSSCGRFVHTRARDRLTLALKCSHGERNYSTENQFHLAPSRIHTTRSQHHTVTYITNLSNFPSTRGCLAPLRRRDCLPCPNVQASCYGSSQLRFRFSPPSF
jgi:hypothetical protein